MLFGNGWSKAWARTLLALAMLVGLNGFASAQTILLQEDFEGLDLGPNVDEGLNDDNPQDAVWSPDGPEGWVVDRSGVPGYGTAADGVIEFAGWNFVDPIWWGQVAGQGRENFDSGGFVIAVADGDEWDDAYHEPGLMNTFMTTPNIPVTDLAGQTESLLFVSSWIPEAMQTATISASFDGSDPVEVLRWESDDTSSFYQPDTQLPEEFDVPVTVPAGAQNVQFTFGYTDAGNNWWWAVDDIEFGNYFESFEDVELGPNIEEGRAIPVDNVWTKEPPAGWTIEDFVPGQDEPNENNGVTEWIGWSFTNKDWWVGAAGDQARSEFTLGQGTVAVADPDEWDDEDHPDSASEGWYNTYFSTPEISLAGVDAGSVELKFDSSWRPEFDDDYQQTGIITVSFDGGEDIEIDLWSSDGASPFFKDYATNETLTYSIDNPGDASSMVITFGMFDAGNDWWWAIDNVVITASGGGGLRGDFNGDGMIDAADIDALTTESAAGSNNATYDLNGDNLVNAADVTEWITAADIGNSYVGDANLDGEFNSGDFVQVFQAGKYETGNAAVWSEGDWNGDGVFASGDFVVAFQGGGYELGPKAAVSAVPEPGTLVLFGLGSLMLIRRRR